MTHRDRSLPEIHGGVITFVTPETSNRDFKTSVNDVSGISSRQFLSKHEIKLSHKVKISLEIQKSFCYEDELTQTSLL
jgi:hypothetical protein